MKEMVLVDSRIPKAPLYELAKHADIEYFSHHTEALRKIHEAKGIICTLSFPLPAETLERAKKLKVISNYAVGFNNIDMDFCNQNKILVCNTPDVLTPPTADITIALMLMVSRLIQKAQKDVWNGDWKTWEPNKYLGIDLRGKTLGILGLGRIGDEVARLAATTWDMKILYHNRGKNAEAEKKWNAKRVEVEDLFLESDVVTLHTPLTPQTRGIINEKALSSMKENAILINVARGELIVTPDLVRALDSNKLFGVGLDVTDPEPLPSDHPLTTFENVVILPHIGSATQIARLKMAEMCVSNTVKALKGEEPDNWVNLF